MKDMEAEVVDADRVVVIGGFRVLDIWLDKCISWSSHLATRNRGKRIISVYSCLHNPENEMS